MQSRFIHSFLKRIGQSVYSPAYYRDLIKQKFGPSLRYFFGLVAVLSVISTAIFAFRDAPRIQQFAETLGPRLVAYFPPELAVAIENGTAKTNVAEPYALPLPNEMKGMGMGGIENLIVIDTKTPFTLQQFADAKTVILLKSESVAYRQGTIGSIVVQPLRELPDYRINRDSVERLWSQVRPVVGYIGVIASVGAFVAVLLVLISKLLYLVFGAVLVLVIAYFIGRSMTYRQAYLIGLHAITLPMLLQTIFFVAGVPPIVPFLQSFLFGLVVVANLTKAHELDTHPSHHTKR